MLRPAPPSALSASSSSQRTKGGQQFAGACAALALASSALLAGCGMHGSPLSSSGATPAVTPGGTGHVYGGQQPVVGSHIYLYSAASTTGGASHSLLNGSGFATTDASGSFDITGRFTCQSPSDQVYVLALGGDAGAGSNPAIAMMSALGPCGNLTASTFIWINEITTVAAVYNLAPYMTDATHVGSPAAAALASAFASTRNMVDPATGVAPSVTAVGRGTVPQAAIDSLANSLAACINSGNGSNQCSALFSATTVNSVVPADTVQATLNVANHPTQNTAAIYNLATSQPPFQPTLTSPPASFALPVVFGSDILTYFYDSSRTGVQSHETQLTPATVNSAGFGKKRTFATDGYLFAQPLYVGGFGMPDGAVHDLLMVTSIHGTVYAFDADGSVPAPGYLWKSFLIPAGERPLTPADYFNCGNPSPETTLLATPVIDRATATFYVVSKTINTSSGQTVQRLHALSLYDGTEKPGSPTVIASTVTTQSGTQVFNPLTQNQRSALLLDHGTVWIAWASHCDQGAYHGYVMGYNASTLAQTAVFNSTPSGTDGGIWLGAGGPAADAQGNVYVVTGNGTFNPSAGNYGDAGLRLTPPTSGTALTVGDYFVPSNQAALSQADLDVGVSEPILFNDPASGVAPNLMLITDKTGVVYVLNRDNMGQYDTGTHGTNSLNNDVQEFKLSGSGLWNNLALFNNHLYTGASGAALASYTFTPGTASTAGSFALSSQTTTAAPGNYSSGGFAPTISANGTANGIVWAVTHNGTTSVLYAFDASDVSREIYDSSQGPNQRDLPPAPVKFTSPVVANGQVFLGGQNSIAVYGLLP